MGGWAQDQVGKGFRPDCCDHKQVGRECYSRRYAEHADVPNGVCPDCLVDLLLEVTLVSPHQQGPPYGDVEQRLVNIRVGGEASEGGDKGTAGGDARDAGDQKR